VTAFEVDLAQLDAVVADLTTCGTALAERLAELDAAVAEGEQEWTGTAAAAQASAHQQIMAGAHELHAALLGLQAAARQAHLSYTAGVTANAATWRHLG